MHEQFKWDDACPNIVQFSPKKVQFHKIGLNIEVLTQKPQNLENHLINLKDIDELIIRHDRVQKLMTKYINLTSQFHQFNPNWTKSPIRINFTP